MSEHSLRYVDNGSFFTRIDALSKLPPDDFPRDGKAAVLNAFGASQSAGLGGGVRLLK